MTLEVVEFDKDKDDPCFYKCKIIKGTKYGNNSSFKKYFYFGTNSQVVFIEDNDK